jgi:putative membrane protein
MTSEPMTSESVPPEPIPSDPTMRGPITIAPAGPAAGPAMVESGSRLPSAMGVAVPDTRLHPIYLVTETANTLRQAIPFLMVTILGGAPWQVNVALFALIMMVATAQWYVRKYSVIGGVLRVRSGLINRMVRIVPISRITALEAHRSLVQRLIGVWGLNVQSPGDGAGAAVSLASLSGRRLDELRVALESGRAHEGGDEERYRGRSKTIRRYLAWRHTETVGKGPDVIAVLNTPEMLLATVTNNTIPLIFAGALVIWFRFTSFVPDRAADIMKTTVEPRGIVAVLVALVVVAVVGGVVFGALRLNRFTLIRDGDVIRNTRGLLGKQSATIPVRRVQAVRIVEGFTRGLFGYCTLQVEVAGFGRANTNQRMLFPFVRTERAAALIRRALPELALPEQPLRPVPRRIYRKYYVVPLNYAYGFTLLALFLPGWWALIAALPIPLAMVLGYFRGREARWGLDEETVVLRWRRIFARNTVIAHRAGVQSVEWSSSPWKAKAHVAGFIVHFSSGREAKIRYMVDADALMLLHAVGRPDAEPGPAGGRG